MRSVRKRSPFVRKRPQASAAENRCETQNCRRFRVASKASTLSAIGGRGVLVAKRRSVVAFGLAGRLRVSSPFRETPNCRRFWTCVGSPRMKSVHGLRDRGCPGRETQKCRHFWTRSRVAEERREERRERREERGEERGERKEESIEERGERGDRGEGREKRRERRGERREDDPGPESPDWFRAWGVIVIAVYASRVCIRVRGSYQAIVFICILCFRCSLSQDYYKLQHLELLKGCQYCKLQHLQLLKSYANCKLQHLELSEACQYCKLQRLRL